MRLGIVLMAAALAVGCAPRAEQTPTEGLQIAPDIESRRARFEQSPLTADVDHLSEGDREALRHLVDAAGAIDEIFKLQAWASSPDFAAKLVVLEGPEAAVARDYYRIMYGPWDRLDELEPFIGDAPHPPGAGYYPEDLTKDEFDAWLEAHPEDRESFTSLFDHLHHRPVKLNLGRSPQRLNLLASLLNSPVDSVQLGKDVISLRLSRPHAKPGP
jgi:hypothetical protein